MLDRTQSIGEKLVKWLGGIEEAVALAVVRFPLALNFFCGKPWPVCIVTRPTKTFESLVVVRHKQMQAEKTQILCTQIVRLCWQDHFNHGGSKDFSTRRWLTLLSFKKLIVREPSLRGCFFLTPCCGKTEQFEFVLMRQTNWSTATATCSCTFASDFAVRRPRSFRWKNWACLTVWRWGLLTMDLRHRRRISDSWWKAGETGFCMTGWFGKYTMWNPKLWLLFGFARWRCWQCSERGHFQIISSNDRPLAEIQGLRIWSWNVLH